MKEKTAKPLETLSRKRIGYLVIGGGLPWALQASATSECLRLAKALSESSLDKAGGFSPTGSK